MNKIDSPEERLLKHLRQAKLQNPGDRNLVSGSKNSVTVAFASSRANERSVFPLLDSFLVLISLCLAGYIGYIYLASQKKVVDFPQKSDAVTAFANEQIIVKQPRPFSVYEQKLSQRDIFESPLQSIRDRNNPSLPEPQTFGRTLKLVGIILDEEKEAVIEDLQDRQTYFLKTGDEIHSAVVQDIREGKVTLQYDEEIIELVQ